MLIRISPFPALLTDDPELTFDLNKFRRQSKDADAMPVKIKELLRKDPAERTGDEVANVSIRSSH